MSDFEVVPAPGRALTPTQRKVLERAAYELVAERKGLDNASRMAAEAALVQRLALALSAMTAHMLETSR